MIDLSPWLAPAPRVLALGFFDGVHLGHQALLKQARALAEEKGLPCVALTFANHPITLLRPDSPLFLLTTRDERRALIEALGIDLSELPFTRELAQTSPEDFLDALAKTGARALMAGYNYTFGAGGAGKAMDLQAGPIPALIAPALCRNGQVISSSRIRRALERGNMALARELLGRRYTLSGQTVPGKQLGRRLDFPTLNLRYPPEKALPASGVYTGWVNGQPAVINAGTNPTVDSGPAVRVEAHILGETALGYGDAITLAFGKRLRGEQRFPDVNALRAQVLSDLETARAWHQHHSLTGETPSDRPNNIGGTTHEQA